MFLTKGKRNREEEDEIVSCAVLNAIAKYSQLDSQLFIPLELNHTEGLQTFGMYPNDLIFFLQDSYQESSSDFLDAYQQLLQKTIPFFRIESTGEVTIDQKKTSGGVILAGSFNPLHKAHIGLLEKAQSVLKALEVSFPKLHCLVTHFFNQIR